MKLRSLNTSVIFSVTQRDESGITLLEMWYSTDIVLYGLLVVPSMKYRGHAGRSWLRHCTTTLKFAGSIPDVVTGIFY